VIAFVVDDLSGSVAEIDLKHIVLDAPVPRPIQQLKVKLPSGDNAYLDLAWPDRMRLVEADGFEAHGRPETLQHDLWRQNQLMELGWEIRRFTATEIRDEPLRVRADIVRFVNKPFRAD
jgi:very-short-patch-repair endonuclease